MYVYLLLQKWLGQVIFSLIDFGFQQLMLMLDKTIDTHVNWRCQKIFILVWGIRSTIKHFHFLPVFAFLLSIYFLCPKLFDLVVLNWNKAICIRFQIYPFFYWELMLTSNNPQTPAIGLMPARAFLKLWSELVELMIVLSDI